MIKRWIAGVMLACVIASAAHAGAPKIGEGDIPPDVFDIAADLTRLLKTTAPDVATAGNAGSVKASDEAASAR